MNSCHTGGVQVLALDDRTNGAPILTVLRKRRVLFVDRVRILRQSLLHMLQTTAPDLATEGVGRPSEARMQRPDIVLLNMTPVGIDEQALGERIAEVQKTFNEVPVIVVSSLDDQRVVIRTQHKIIRCYLASSVSVEVTVAAIRLVAAGGKFRPDGLILRGTNIGAGAEVSALVCDEKLPTQGTGLRLTAREAEVFRRLQVGKPNKIIAHELEISEGTVKIHVGHIMRKLNATNRTQAAFSMQLDTVLQPWPDISRKSASRAA